MEQCRDARAFFGVPDTMKAADGTPTNAIRGLLDFIARLVENHRPTHLVACWDDNWRPAWRVALIPSYKAQRVEFVTPKGEQVLAVWRDRALVAAKDEIRLLEIKETPVARK